MEVLMTLLKIIIMIVVPVATSVLTYVAKNHVDLLINKYVTGETAEALKKGVEIIANCVDYVQQTYVDNLKKEGQFTTEAHEEALTAAKERAISLMNNEVTKAIENSYGSIDVYVETVIESIIASKK